MDFTPLQFRECSGSCIAIRERWKLDCILIGKLTALWICPLLTYRPMFEEGLRLANI
jgi:hypothetical protein